MKLTRFLFLGAIFLAIVIILNNSTHEKPFNPFQFTEAVSSSSNWKNLAPGVDYRITLLENNLKNDKSAPGLTMIRMEQNLVRSKLLFAKDFGKTSMTVKEMVEKSGAIAGINASYFDEYDAPLGFLKTEKSLVNDYIATPIIYSAVFSIKKGKGSIIHRDSFNPSLYDEAVQVGPRLIAKGKPTTGLNNTVDYREKARRSGLAIDKKGRIIIFVTSPSYAEMNWQEIQGILSMPPQDGGIEPEDVMNLDGGGSSQLFIKTGKVTLDEGYSNIPVAIGFFKKS